ncbi:uncharacterized protein LODBEIA_P23530 [Lodderomyces beijingensis]|uniref:prephenate dehydratase n=1 Tax=Lodderomyces beijingensis TaxID=1775926 RepID=A0ABP0ZJ10_9ASCO
MGSEPDQLFSCSLDQKVLTSQGFTRPLLPFPATTQMKVAFLGPEGTYTHQAVLQQFHPNVEISPKKSIGECFEAIDSQTVDYAVVPFENSTNGQVVFTYDLLRDWFLDPQKSCNFRIVGEQFVSIHHNLLSHGSNIEAIETIYSHPQVWTQVSKFLKSLSSKCTRLDTASTSQAAELASRDKSGKIAAISSMMSARLYQVPILREGVEDNVDNTTRFLVLGYDTPPRYDRRKEGEEENRERVTSLMFTLPNDNPGALCDVLVKFKKHGINLTSINSRPANLENWQYVFFVETSGIDNGEALHDIQQSCLTFIDLGTFDRNWRYNSKKY